MKKNSKRKGFTLVELLIVIVVIGVLSAMMMLSSTEAVSSAKAADIVSDLRNLKTAALAYYADNLDTVDATTPAFDLDTIGKVDGTNDKRKPILKYMNNDDIDAGYEFTDNGKEWYVKYNGTGLTSKVAEKLKSRAKSVGLLKSTTSTDSYADATISSTVPPVYMFIR